MATFQLTDGSLGRLAKRTKGLISLLVFAVVYASLSMSPDESMVRPTYGLEVRSDELSQRFLREKGDSPDNVSTPTVANEEEEDAPKRAIFLMSFGASASKSTLVERCVLSMRRRGEFNGPVVILTDAPVERYEDAFDKNVFVINNKEEDMKSGYFSAGALKYKRFKTLVLDYIDLVHELDDIDWVYYLDIDVLMGAPFHNLLHNLEEKYSIGSDSEDGENEDEDKELVSKLYVFKDHGDAKRVVGNSGFIIMNRHTSGYCLDLWRTEIDDHPEARFDQASLTTVALMDDSEKEMQCQVIPMEREEFISYPVRSYTLQNMMAESSYTPLIHILNSYKANAIGSYVTEKFVKNVLQLSEEEVEEHKFGKAVIRPSWYDWRKNTSEITALRISTMPELGLV